MEPGFIPHLILSYSDRAFFDFDNTITSFDVLDDIIMKFCQDDRWQEFEMLWQKGEIGSGECLKAQMNLVKASQSDIEKYLYGIEIDPYFKKLLLLFQESGIKTIILSDSFRFFIESILENNGITNVDIYANELEFTGEGIKVFFPYYSSSACSMCGHCKKETFISLRGEGKTIFIGDGHYDSCAAHKADFIFAKGDMAKNLSCKNIDFVEFNSLLDIYNYFVPSYKEMEI